jgi:hypothetical protein
MSGEWLYLLPASALAISLVDALVCWARGTVAFESWKTRNVVLGGMHSWPNGYVERLFLPPNVDNDSDRIQARASFLRFLRDLLAGVAILGLTAAGTVLARHL